MLLTGEPIKAKFAKELGLINDYFPKSKLNSEVFKIAKKLHQNQILQSKLENKLFINS